MQKIAAIRLDGMVRGAHGHLDAVAHNINANAADDDEARLMLRAIGTAMAALMDISAEIYRQHPDAKPPDLVANE